MFGPARGKTLNISQKELARLAARWEPAASASRPTFRRATCVECGRSMTRMWHVWFTYILNRRHWVKELHICRGCGQKYEVKA